MMALPHAIPAIRPASNVHFAAGARRLWRAWQARRRYRREMRDLESLSPRLLRDVGLSRDRFGNWRRDDG